MCYDRVCYERVCYERVCHERVCYESVCHYLGHECLWLYRQAPMLPLVRPVVAVRLHDRLMKHNTP